MAGGALLGVGACGLALGTLTQPPPEMFRVKLPPVPPTATKVPPTLVPTQTATPALQITARK